ncbi:MAG: hypothetical protein J5595_05835 [Bacteroidales bacterium]|nr:hypothetical protein [Bacteroidales bacterium]
MKKILSAIAALMVCAVLMVSCKSGGNGPYAAEVKTIQDNKDATEVGNAIYTIILNYEKANADEIVAAYHALSKIDASKVDESKLKYKDPKDKDNFETNMMLCWERVKAQDPDLFKKEDEAFKNAPDNREHMSLDDFIKMGQAVKQMKAEMPQ